MPWIHDAYVTAAQTTARVEYEEGQEKPAVVRFVAHNSRQCESLDLKRLKEYVALMQPIGVKRLDGDETPRY